MGSLLIAIAAIRTLLWCTGVLLHCACAAINSFVSFIQRAETLLKMISAKPENNYASSDQKNRMKKELGLLEGVAIILGLILGSGKQYTSYVLMYSNTYLLPIRIAVSKYDCMRLRVP